MRKTLGCWLVLAVAGVFAVALIAEAASGTGGTGTGPTNKTTKTVSYIVVEVRSMQADISFEAIPSKDLADRIKKCQTDYAESLKQWEKDKADAKKKGEKFEEKKPIRPWVKRMGTTVFQDLEKATAYADKLQQQFNEQKKKAEEKKLEREKPAPPKPETPAGATDTKGDAGDTGGAAE